MRMSAKLRKLPRSSRRRSDNAVGVCQQCDILPDVELGMHGQHSVRQEIAEPRIRPSVDDMTRDEVEIRTRIHVV